MTETETIQKELAELLIEDYKGEMNIKDFTGYLFSKGVININTALKVIIKATYSEILIKNNSSNFKAELDIAVKYNVSRTFVQNCIYKNNNIKF